MTDNARTAQELAGSLGGWPLAEVERLCEALDGLGIVNGNKAAPAAASMLRRLAALASQAEPVAPNGAKLLQREATQEMLDAASATPGIQAIDAAASMHQLRGYPCDPAAFADGSPLQQAWRAMWDTAPPIPAQAEPTMSDAIAAGDGTLHSAIDYWQQRASEDGRDAARLDFMIESDAFVVWSFRGDGSIKQCQLWSQDEDEEYHIISGERYFNTPREAIDAAIAAKEQS